MQTLKPSAMKISLNFYFRSRGEYLATRGREENNSELTFLTIVDSLGTGKPTTFRSSKMARFPAWKATCSEPSVLGHMRCREQTQIHSPSSNEDNHQKKTVKRVKRNQRQLELDPSPTVHFIFYPSLKTDQPMRSVHHAGSPIAWNG